MSNYKQPLTAEDLQALVDYTEQASQILDTLDGINNFLPAFPVTAMEKARWEIRRLDNPTQNK